MVKAGTEFYLKRSPTNFLEAERNHQSDYSPAPENAGCRSAGSDHNPLHPPHFAPTGRYPCRASGSTPHELAATSLSVGRRYSPSPEEIVDDVSRPLWLHAAWAVAQ